MVQNSISVFQYWMFILLFFILPLIFCAAVGCHFLIVNKTSVIFIRFRYRFRKAWEQTCCLIANCKSIRNFSIPSVFLDSSLIDRIPSLPTKPRNWWLPFRNPEIHRPRLPPSLLNYPCGVSPLAMRSNEGCTLARNIRSHRLRLRFQFFPLPLPDAGSASAPMSR